MTPWPAGTGPTVADGPPGGTRCAARGAPAWGAPTRRHRCPHPPLPLPAQPVLTPSCTGSRFTLFFLLASISSLSFPLFSSLLFLFLLFFLFFPSLFLLFIFFFLFFILLFSSLLFFFLLFLLSFLFHFFFTSFSPSFSLPFPLLFLLLHFFCFSSFFYFFSFFLLFCFFFSLLFPFFYFSSLSFFFPSFYFLFPLLSFCLFPFSVCFFPLFSLPPWAQQLSPTPQEGTVPAGPQQEQHQELGCPVPPAACLGPAQLSPILGVRSSGEGGDTHTRV